VTSPAEAATQADAGSRRPEEGAITEERVSQLRRRVGKPIPFLDPAFEYAGVDSMRNYARGIGDVNAFYRDPDHARSSRWGSFTAHPTFMLYMGVSSERELSPELLETGKGDPLAGVHAFYSQEEMEWFLPINEGDRLSAKGGLGSVEVKASRMGRNAVHETHETVYRNQGGALVGIRRQLLVRVERAAARSKGKNLDLDVPHVYTADELKAIEAEYESEHIQGPELRYWEDVQVGEPLVPLLKGPYTVTAYICYAEGTGPRNSFHRAHSVAYRYRKEHPRAFPPNEFGIPDTVARVHWDKTMALRAGLPETYDFGGERVAWMSHAATNWMGDDAFLRRLQVRISAFCFVGDTVRIGGRVAGKRQEHGNNAADLQLEATNQRGEIIATAVATVVLPSKTAESVTLPADSAAARSVFL
jgi:acyl dehydratase